MKQAKTVVEKRHVIEVVEGQTGRKCAVCGEAAVRAVFRIAAAGGREGVDWSSRKFLCRELHTERLWLDRVRLKPAMRPPKRGGRDAGFRGDMSNEYRRMVEEMGGEVPMPDREKPVKPRKKVWKPVHRSALRLVSPRARTRRPDGMSGRQWVKFRKAEGLGSKSR